MDLPSWMCMVSAQNPMDCVLTRDESQRLHEHLVSESQAEGTLIDQGWVELDEHEEDMVLVSGNAMTYAVRYEQRDVFAFDLEAGVLEVLESPAGVMVRQRRFS